MDNPEEIRRDRIFAKALGSGIIDPALFRKLCYAGVPMKYRPTAYRILLGVVGLNTAGFKRTIAGQQAKYEKYLGAFGKVEVSLDREIEHQIEIDVLRISPFYRVWNGTDISQAYANVLRLTAYQRPYLGYVQGMADVIAPFWRLFLSADSGIQDQLVSAQASVFFCFSRILHRIQGNIHDMQSSLLRRTEAVLEVIDPAILIHLVEIGLDLHMVCFRWFSCLFIREFQPEAWFRLFDSMLCDDLEDFLVFFSTALLVWHRDALLSSDFSTVIIQMQSLQEAGLSTEAVEELIGSANYLRKEYKERIR